MIGHVPQSAVRVGDTLEHLFFVDGSARVPCGCGRGFSRCPTFLIG